MPASTVADYAKFAETSMLKTQTDFLPSCNLMELDVPGNTTISDTNSTIPSRVVFQDGGIYYLRVLTLSMEFLSGLFMHIEQKEEYTGKVKLLCKSF